MNQYIARFFKNFFEFFGHSLVSDISEDELRKANFGYRAKYIVKSVEKILANGGTQWIYDISKLPYKDCLNQLLTLTGIGRKVADCIALYSVNYSKNVI